MSMKPQANVIDEKEEKERERHMNNISTSPMARTTAPSNTTARTATTTKRVNSERIDHIYIHSNMSISNCSNNIQQHRNLQTASSIICARKNNEE